MPRSVKRVSHPPRLTRKTQVAAYARVSSAKDAMLHSMSAQVSYYSNLIQKHDEWEYVGVYADEAVTGTKDSRDDFQRMLADCRDGKIDLILTKSISRFARNTVTLLETVRELKTLDVDVYFEEQNIHSMSTDGELMLTILASYAQEESLSASENQKWRIRKGFENGELVNLRFLYGYDIERGKITINTQEVNDVRHIFSAFLGGATFGELASEMRKAGKVCRNGGRWCQQRIRELLSNEKYTGDALLQKRYRNNHLEKRELRNNGCLPKFYAEGTHEAIIDTGTFERAQTRLIEIAQRHSGRQAPQDSVFTGMLSCPKCGKNYKRITSNGSVGWNCSTYMTEGKTSCHGKKIPEDTLVSVCSEVLGTVVFNKAAFRASVYKILVPEPNHLLFLMTDGQEVEKVWCDRSRRDSWTDDMKEVARQRTIHQRRENPCQEQ